MWTGTQVTDFERSTAGFVATLQKVIPCVEKYTLSCSATMAHAVRIYSSLWDCDARSLAMTAFLGGQKPPLDFEICVSAITLMSLLAAAMMALTLMAVISADQTYVSMIIIMGMLLVELATKAHPCMRDDECPGATKMTYLPSFNPSAGLPSLPSGAAGCSPS
jgi:hypothetical protein